MRLNLDIQVFFDKGYKYLVERGLEPREAKIQSERLLCHHLGVSKQEIGKTPILLSDFSEKTYLSLLAKRVSGFPLQYIEGTADFMDFSFRINEQVLIPRPETENLVEVIVQRLNKRKTEPLEFLDLGTGSGCILLSLLKYFDQSNGLGVDSSEEALEIANKNTIQLQLENRAQLLKSCWFESVELKKFDVIVSNPPYIADQEWDSLAKEVRQEPRQALLAGNTGLECYEKIIQRALSFLKPNGMIFFEVGWKQASDVKRLLEAANFKQIEIILDDCRIERIVKATN